MKIIRSVVAKGNPIDPAIHSMAEWRPKMSRKVADDLAAFHQNVRAGPIRADPLGTRGATWCIAGDQTWWFQAYIYISFVHPELLMPTFCMFVYFSHISWNIIHY